MGMGGGGVTLCRDKRVFVNFGRLLGDNKL